MGIDFFFRFWGFGVLRTFGFLGWALAFEPLGIFSDSSYIGLDLLRLFGFQVLGYALMVAKLIPFREWKHRSATKGLKTFAFS